MIIKIHDKEFRPYISAQELDTQISRLAKEIKTNLGDKKPLFVAILNGSFMFASDLLKKYERECEIAFVKLSSYQGVESSQTIKELVGLTHNVEGRDIIIIEDIVDTGNTLTEIYRIFQDKKVASLQIATLFFKPEAYVKNLDIHYIGFSIENKFIVGYGLDYDELGRNLPEIYQLNS